MPLFDRNRPFREITPEVIDEANLLVDRLRARLISDIILPEPSTGLRVPNLVRCYLQAHLRRCLMFLEAGAAESAAGRPLATELCTRAVYENVATICDFSDKVKALCEAVDYSGVEQLVTKAAFTTRIPSFIAQHGEDAKAPQILNQVDKMDKRYPNFRTAYDHLSDIVHPNGLGAVVYFATFGDGLARFADAGNDPNRARVSLIAAALIMLHVELALIQTEQRLQKLSAEVAAGASLGPREHLREQDHPWTKTDKS
jgi:hypothetical protein